MIYCERKAPRRLIEDIEPFAEEKLKKVVRRPFNRFKPTMTGWWLVPSNDLPFYHHGKLYFDWADDKMGTITCGFYLEKGLAPEVAVVYPSRKGKSLIMNKKWQWPHFAESCADGSFARALKNAALESGLPVEIHVSGGYVDDPSLYDPYSEKQKKDHYVFDLDKDCDTIKYRCAKRDAMVLKPLNKIKNLSSFNQVMQEFSNDHFMWLNVYIGAKFNVFEDELPADANVWSPQKIWDEFLSYFAPWVK
jgi:hypothetical protein